jgi:hypothetical protein
VTAVTTTEAQGGAAIEAKCATAVEQRPPSFTLRHNRWRRRSSLDGGPLLWQLNDGGHGSGRGDAPLPARRRRWRKYRQGLDLDPMGLGLSSAVFFIFKIPFFVSVGNDRYYKPLIFYIIQIVSVAGADTKYRFPTDTINTFCCSGHILDRAIPIPSRTF